MAAAATDASESTAAATVSTGAHRPWRQSLETSIDAQPRMRRKPNEDAPPPTPTAAKLQYGRMGKQAYGIQRGASLSALCGFRLPHRCARARWFIEMMRLMNLGHHVAMLEHWGTSDPQGGYSLSNAASWARPVAVTQELPAY